jgi:hypothetical protein
MPYPIIHRIVAVVCRVVVLLQSPIFPSAWRMRTDFSKKSLYGNKSTSNAILKHFCRPRRAQSGRLLVSDGKLPKEILAFSKATPDVRQSPRDKTISLLP